MKKFALLCSAMLCSQVVYCDISKQIEEYVASDLEGITVGIDFGYSHSNLKNDQYAREFFSRGKEKNVHDDMSETVKKKRCNTDISLNVGYSCFYENWYFGAAGELSFGENTKKIAVLDEYFPTKSKISGFSTVFKLKGGYYFKDLNAVIYGIAGLKWRNAEMQYQFDDKAISAIGSKAKLSTPLYTVGIGIERPIYKKISVSAEYEHTWRNSKDISKLEHNSTHSYFYIKQRMKEHSFKIGIKYHV